MTSLDPSSPITTQVGNTQARGPRAEALAEAIELVHKRTGNIPARWIAAQVIATHYAADWPVIRDGVQAVVRRFEQVRSGDLRVAQRPANRRLLGVYRTKRKRASIRPYRTVISRIRAAEDASVTDGPMLVGSCDCADYVFGSLGLCKHLLAVLHDLAGKPKSWQRVTTQQEPELRPTLRWDPIRPLSGMGDWLGRVYLSCAPDRSEPTLRKIFAPGSDAVWRIRNVHADNANKRRALCQTIKLLVKSSARRGMPADSALAPLLEREFENSDRAKSCQLAANQMERHLKTMKRTLYDYQKEGVARFLSTGRLLLGDDMGLGKTAQAIGASVAMWRSGRVKRGLLVVPASLKYQWQREWNDFAEVPIAIVEGSPADRRAIYASTKKGFLIANYEQVLRDLELMQEFAPDLVILDEAQRIKNWATQTANGVKRLTPKYRLVLTGTPFENRLLELASVLEWVDAGAMEPKWRIVPWHAVTQDKSREIIGARNLETLRARLAPSLLRRSRSEVLSQLPSRTDTRVSVEMTPAQVASHDDLIVPIAQLIQTSNRRPLRQEEFMRLMMLLNLQRVISNGLAQVDFVDVWPTISARKPSQGLLRQLDSPKLSEFREIFKRIGLEQGRKIVVFSQWRRMLELAHWVISDLLTESHKRAVFFSGKVSQRKRTQNVIDLHDDADTVIMFATDAGGTGLNLQRAATCVINLETPWNPAVLEQRIGRIHRMGQDKPIDVYDLVCDYGIESRIAKLVADKGALFRSVFDGETDVVQFDGSGSFLAGVKKIVDVVDVTRGTSELDLNADADARVIAMAEAADEDVDSVEASTASDSPKADSGVAIRELFAGVEVQKTAGGGLRIEAGPEQAQALTALFEGMAGLLRSSST